MYIDKSYMISRYSEKELASLTDRVEPYTNAIVDDVLDQSMEAATGEAESYISQRYKTPLNPVPEAVKTHVSAIAFYHLHRGRYTTEARQGYDDALMYFKSISKGLAHLVAEGSEVAAPSADAKVIAPDRTFSRQSLKDF